MALFAQQENYWMSTQALNINLNALADPDYIELSVLSDAIIMAYIPEIIPYDASYNFRRWKLQGTRTYFETTTEKYIYACLDRRKGSTVAKIVFPSIRLDVLGQQVDDNDGIVGGEDAAHYYIYLGKISSSIDYTGSKISRTWLDGIRTGTLSTDKHIQEDTTGDWAKMFKLNPTSDLIEVLKKISSIDVSKLNIGDDLKLKDKIINDITTVNEYLTKEPSDTSLPTTSLISKLFLELHSIFMHKDRSDSTSFLQKFLGGIEVGEYIDDLVSGKGIGLHADGRLQARRVEAQSATFLEVIFNRITAMESDYTFSEAGTIDSVTLNEDGSYTLPIRKRHDNDFTALAENDVVFGVVNSLSGGLSVRTSWLRIVSVNTVSNTITAVLYPNNEVPGGVNYPPEPLMILSHRGNPVNEDRQSYWYLSSREKCICMLDGVTKPILEEYNYACIMGKLKNLSLFDNLPINYRQTYNYVRGLVAQDILRVDYAGVPLRSENCKGKWAAGTYTSTSTSYDSVYHVGCKWMCIVASTTAEPRWNSTDWAMIEGNSELTMSVASSHGNNFYAGRVATTFIPSVYWGNNDISADVLPTDWAWTRNSGNVTLDNAWAVAHAGSGRNLAISNEDLPPSWSRTNPVEFICTAYVRDGETVTQLSISKSV